MVSKRKKKYSTGEGAQFISRRNALRKLQLSLNDFRRLCIIKGIYPREPRNRKRAQKGVPGIKTLYHVKDIQFLMHEPIIWKLREYKIFNRRVGRAKAIKDFKAMRRYLANHPTLKLDHIVKERYPTFTDAVRDLDDCLTLCFLFSTFPSISHIPRTQSYLCKRLTMEFLHAVIEAKALRKVFISIKGYYYQAELKGQTITWIVPHHFSFEPQSRAEVDFKIMSTFVEFYIIMLGFVNFRLYNTLNLYYPPKFASADISETEKALVDENSFVSERVSALNCVLSKTTTGNEEEIEVDDFNLDDNPEAIEMAHKEAESIQTLKTLFKGLKFFLNREVPREPLVFIIRCFGGEVSWEKSLFIGATFEETDESISHQIVDRPSMEKKYISRYYIQPQWVFDCVNSRTLLPVNKYFMGEVLPPHLSPFVDKDRDEGYVPPEERALYDPEALEQMHKEESEDETESENEKVNDDINAEENKVSDNEYKRTGESVDVGDGNKKADIVNSKKQKLGVKPGQVKRVEPWQKKREERQEFKLREKMIKRKHRNLYKSMMKAKQERGKEAWLLKKKRKTHEENQQVEKKLKNKQRKLEGVKQN